MVGPNGAGKTTLLPLAAGLRRPRQGTIVIDGVGLNLTGLSYNGTLWALYMHPLAELSREQLPDAMSQVYWAAENFGTSYNSSDLAFGAGDED